MENIFRAESLLQIAAPIGNELKAQSFRELPHKFRLQVWAPPVLMRNQFALRLGLAVRIKVKRKQIIVFLGLEGDRVPIYDLGGNEGMVKGL